MPGSDWRDHYETRTLTAEEVVATIASGSSIYIPNAHDSATLTAALLGRAGELTGIRLRSLGMWKDYGFQNPGWQEIVRANVSMGTPLMRRAINEGVVDYTVTGFGDSFRNIDQGRPGSEPFDVCWFTVTPPNASGFCCAGAELWDLRTAIKRSKVNVAAVNENIPRTYGDTWVHVSEIDYFVEDHDPVPPRFPYEISDVARQVARHVSGIVRDRDTLQVGTGSTSATLAEAGAFDDKEDLGYFSEMSNVGVIDLVKRGVITSKYATLHPNKFVTTGLTGGPEEYAYVNDNPFFEFYDYDYMLNPAVICRNDNLVAINNALSVDLRGQINLISFGPQIHSGSGGQLSFHVGAYLSKGGRAVTVLPSTTTDGSISRIVPEHPAGQMVTIPWDLADTVVTEHGVAELMGKTMRQRAQALIEIAHPDHQADLREAARRLL